jgi:hypothetical protein
MPFSIESSILRFVRPIAWVFSYLEDLNASLQLAEVEAAVGLMTAVESR